MAIIEHGRAPAKVVARALLRTTSETPLVLWKRAIPTGTALRIRATVSAVQSDGSVSATFVREVTVRRASGDAALDDVAEPSPNSPVSTTWGTGFAVDTSTQELQLTAAGATGTVVDWTADVEAHPV